MKHFIYVFLLILFSFSSYASADDFTLRLAKTPDSKDSNLPATLTYQANDSGNKDYITQGAIKANRDFGVDNQIIFSPNVSWNHNSLITKPTNNWATGANLVYMYIYGEAEHLDLDLGMKWQRDIAAGTSSTPVKLDLTWYTNRLASVPWSHVRNYALRPTLSFFWKDIYSADTNTSTTGTLSGGILNFAFIARRNRWSINANTQIEYIDSSTSSDNSNVQRLHSVALNYDFYDQPTTKQQLKVLGWMPGISLTRKVGLDQFNEISSSGYNQIAFTLKY